MLLTMLLVWGIVNVVLLCLWAGIVGFARRGADEGRRALRAELAFTVLALVLVMAGTSLANPSVREVVGSVIQTTTSGFDAPRAPVEATNGTRVSSHQTSSSGRGSRSVAGGSARGGIGAGAPGTSSQNGSGEAGAPAGGGPPVAANPVPPPEPPSESAPPSVPPSESPQPSPGCDGSVSRDPCPSPSDSPGPGAQHGG